MPAQVIFVTGQHEPLINEAMSETGPVAVLAKPYTAEQVRAVLAQAQGAGPQS